MPLFMVFFDLTKAFDSVNRSLVWTMLKKIGCPERFVNLVASLHTNIKTQFRFRSDLSEAFGINNGVKHGFVLAPRLFSIFLSLVFYHAFTDRNKGVLIQSLPGADLFNLNQEKPTRRTQIVLCLLMTRRLWLIIIKTPKRLLFCLPRL